MSSTVIAARARLYQARAAHKGATAFRANVQSSKDDLLISFENLGFTSEQAASMYVACSQKADSDVALCVKEIAAAKEELEAVDPRPDNLPMP